MSELVSDESVYEITLDVVVDTEQLVENRLARLGVPHGVSVEFDAQPLTVPVTFRGQLEELMELAMNHGVVELEEFEELCRPADDQG